MILAQRFRAWTASALALSLGFGGSAQAQEFSTVTSSYNLYGTPGLIDMPTAESAEDGELAGTFAYVGGQARSTLTFQILPRLSGSFRYARIPDYDGDGEDRYDRSFDLRYRFIDEGTYIPAVAIGLQDFVGTGVYSGEYLVATKSFGRREQLRVTAGLGWGRLATNGGRGGFGERDPEFVDTGGTANFDDLFQGPIAPFGGISYTPRPGLTFKAEYSSDDYVVEQERGIFEVESPWNLGVDWEFARGARVSANYLYGNELGVQLTFALNPNDRQAGPGFESAPVPIQARPPRSNAASWTGAWVNDATTQETVRTQTARVLEAEGIKLEAMALNATSAHVRINNFRYGSQTQAIGRAARVLTATLPASVEAITIVPVTDGVPDAAITFRRSDLERLEYAPAEKILGTAVLTSGHGRPVDLVAVQPYPDFTWSIDPFLEVSLFDPDQPVRANAGLALNASVLLGAGWEASTHIRWPIVGNLDEIERESNSELPPVRSNFALYVDDKNPTLDRLQLAWYSRPGENLYGRMTAGYLERMFAGVSTELLWKPVDSRLAFGGELNYVQQRDYDDTFGLLDYDVVTGHVSGYYEFSNGFYGQIDVGRYLAGDYGATFTVDRTFDNGWRIGAFATFTDVPFDEFGEGSFDKGLRFSIPLAWFSGQPTQRTYDTVIRPLTRDGGARLDVDGRLYDRVAGSHQPRLEARSGRFWK